MDEKNSVTKQFFNKKDFSSKVTPIQLSLKKTEADVYQNLLNRKKKIKANFNLGNLCRSAGKRNIFLLKVIQQIGLTSCMQLQKNNIDTTPSHYIKKLPERYNEALLRKTELIIPAIGKFSRKNWSCTSIQFQNFCLVSIWKTNLQTT